MCAHKAALSLFRRIRQQRSILVPVVVYSLDVIVVVEDVEDPADLFHCGLIRHFDVILGDHGHF